MYWSVLFYIISYIGNICLLSFSIWKCRQPLDYGAWSTEGQAGGVVGQGEVDRRAIERNSGEGGTGGALGDPYIAGDGLYWSTGLSRQWQVRWCDGHRSNILVGIAPVIVASAGFAKNYEK